MVNSQENPPIAENDHKMKIIKTDDNNNAELAFVKRIIVGFLLVILFSSIAVTIFTLIHEFIFVRLLHIRLPLLELLDIIIMLPALIVSILGGFSIAKKRY